MWPAAREPQRESASLILSSCQRGWLRITAPKIALGMI
jgi:hypothetical protein